MQAYEEYISELGYYDVFVFGSNKNDGFHGAGSAGFATFNKSGNHWREEGYAGWPHGAKGAWNVKGCGEGFQKGKIGKSYALPTVTKAGAKRSRTPEEISISVKSLYAFALSQPQLRFLIAQDAKMGLNGYSPDEMADMFLCMKIPNNVFFFRPFYDILVKKVNFNR